MPCLGWLSGLSSWPANQKVAGLTPSQSTCLGCRPGLEHTRGNHTLMFLSLSFSLLPLSQRKNKTKQTNKQTKNPHHSPGWCGSVGWRSVLLPKGCKFNSWLRDKPRLWPWSPVWGCTGGNQSVLSCIYVSLFPFLSLKAMKKMSSGEYKKKPHNSS